MSSPLRGRKRHNIGAPSPLADRKVESAAPAVVKAALGALVSRAGSHNRNPRSIPGFSVGNDARFSRHFGPSVGKVFILAAKK